MGRNEIERETSEFTRIDLKALENFRNLEHLDLSGNKISEIVTPVERLKLANLKTLNLASNRIKRLPPDVVLHSLEGLIELDLSNNPLEEIDFKKLEKQLEHSTNFSFDVKHLERVFFTRASLSLMKNQFLLENPTSWFDFLLKMLLIAQPNYTFGQFVSMPNLVELKLIECELKGIADKCFVQLPLLKKLSLSKNRLKEIGAGAFDRLFRLEELDLSENQIGKIDERAFKHLSSMRVLVLASNQLTVTNINRMTFKYFLSSIQLIDLSNNNNINTEIYSYFKKTEEKYSSEIIENFIIKKASFKADFEDFLQEFARLKAFKIQSKQ